MRRNSLLVYLIMSLVFPGIPALAQPLGSSGPDVRMIPGASPTGQTLSNLYSPNLFDGSANISIPIYSYEEGNADYGISLGYNTKGVLVNEISSAIGLHWEMNVGSITRIVKGLPDDIQVAADDSVEISTGVSTNTMIMPNIYTKFKGKYVTLFESPSEAGNAKTYRDRESDQFIVSVGNLFFTFYLGEGGDFFVSPQHKVKIIPLLDGVPITTISGTQMIGSTNNSLLLNFKIEDEQGNTYYFRRGDYENKKIMEGYSDLGAISEYYFTSRWDIERIVLASGAEIKYTYTNTTAPTHLAYYRQHVKTESADVDDREDYPPSDVYPYITVYSKILGVEYPDGSRADFIYDTAERCDYTTGALRKIKISSGGNCFNYLMDQSYMVAINNTTTAATIPYDSCLYLGGRFHRLRLDKIRIQSCDGMLTEPYYAFEYDSQKLPPRLSGAQDVFGYYNGSGTVSDTTSKSIPTHPIFGTGITYTGADRSVKPLQARAGILTKLHNATGGTLEFKYRDHMALTNVLSGLPVDNLYIGVNASDGLLLEEIKQIDKYVPSGNATTIFAYSGGQRFLSGGYFHYPLKMFEGTENPSQIAMTGMYISPHHFVNGSNHGYSQVTTIQVDANGAQLSKQTILFSNLRDSSSAGVISRYQVNGDGKHFYTFPYTDKQYIREWEIGLPLEITDYDQNSRIIHKTINKYSFDMDVAIQPNVKSAMVKRRGVNYPNLPYQQKKEITDTYYLYRGTALLDNSITRTYVSDTRFRADTVTYNYDNKNNLKEVFTRDSDGTRVRMRNVYNYEVAAASGSTLYNMSQQGLQVLVGMERWLCGSGNHTTDHLVDAGVYGFVFQNKRLWPKNLYTLDINAPVSYQAYTGHIGSNEQPLSYSQVNLAFTGSQVAFYRKETEATLFDSKGNPLENRLQDQNQYKAMIWDTTAGNRKLAEAKNARYTDIAYNSFEYNAPGPGGALFVNRGNTSYDVSKVITTQGSISGRHAYRLVSGGQTINGTQNLQSGKEYLLSFWTKGSLPKVYLGATQVSLPTTAAYTHSSNGWKQYILRVTGTDTTFRIVFPASGTSYIDEVRLQPADALMQSNTYEPLLGISSSTDATGRITYYEYDALGRQHLVKDQEGNILSRTKQVVQGPQ